MSSLRCLSLTLLSVCIPLVAAAQPPSWVPFQHRHHPVWKKDPTTLIQKVRRATERFRSLDVATGEGWVQGSPCVSGPIEGAMGVHYVRPERIGDGMLQADEPEALIYQPQPDGSWRLVGVEFIAIADVWDAKGEGPPALEGHLLNLVGTPNRYGLPAFYELHVWAWQHNPSGSFADFNPDVSCDAQPGD